MLEKEIRRFKRKHSENFGLAVEKMLIWDVLERPDFILLK